MAVTHVAKDDSWLDTDVVFFLCGAFCTLGAPDSVIQQPGVDFVLSDNPGAADCGRCLDMSIKRSCVRIRERHSV